MKLSIIMNYYDRQAILERCLWSIHHLTSRADDFEIIIVDDTSPGGGEALPVVDVFRDRLPITLLFRPTKKSRNCGIPLNIAAKHATGDILLTHDPDFVHLTPVVNQMLATFLDGRSKFIVAACYSVSEDNQKVVEASDLSRSEDVVALRHSIRRLPRGLELQEGEDAWNCHSRFRPRGLGSIKGILKRDFMRLGGFDEDFAQHFGYEDTDFLRRVQALNIPAWIRDDMLVLHQWHYHAGDKPGEGDRGEGMQTNSQVYQRKLAEHAVVANRGREWGVL